MVREFCAVNWIYIVLRISACVFMCSVEPQILVFLCSIVFKKSANYWSCDKDIRLTWLLSIPVTNVYEKDEFWLRPTG